MHLWKINVRRLLLELRRGRSSGIGSNSRLVGVGPALRAGRGQNEWASCAADGWRLLWSYVGRSWNFQKECRPGNKEGCQQQTSKGASALLRPVARWLVGRGLFSLSMAALSVSIQASCQRLQTPPSPEHQFLVCFPSSVADSELVPYKLRQFQAVSCHSHGCFTPSRLATTST